MQKHKCINPNCSPEVKSKCIFGNMDFKDAQGIFNHLSPKIEQAQDCDKFRFERRK